MKNIKELEDNINSLKVDFDAEQYRMLQLELMLKLVGDIANLSWNMKTLADSIKAR